jgi:hypothetical protein
MNTRPKNPPRPRESAGVEYRFKIDAYTPDTIPQLRLAEYMRELSQIFGEAAAVHFRRIERGSLVLVSKIEREAIPKVRERVSRVRRGEPAQDALRAYQQMNKLLREDNAVGLLHDEKAKTEMLRFPGREEVVEKFPSVREHGSIDGVLVRIGGTDESVHVTLQFENQQLTGCWTNRAIAKQLAHKLYEPVRLFGRGRWSRDSEGGWTLSDFKIESFEPLQDIPLSAAIAELRAIPVEWDTQAYEELGTIRHGPGEKRNGGH